jgi:predicted dehydrogenase
MKFAKSINNNKSLRVAIIGCGRVSNHYADLILKKKINHCNIIAVCDKIKIKAKILSKKIGGNVYSNYKKMIAKEKLDLILVLTISGSHYQISRYILNHNIHVLCEKPLTMTPAKSLELYKLSKSKKLMCGVIFQNRFNPAIVFLKKALDKKRFGKIVKVSLSVLWCRYQDYYEDGWHGSWKNDGGVINQQAIHHVDVLRWLFGPIKKVNCIITKRINKLQAEDTAAAIIEFSNGSLGTLEATTAARPADLHASISIVGEKGTVIISGLAINKIKLWKFVNQSKIKEKKIIKKKSSKISNGYGFGHITYLNKAFKSIIEKKIEAPVSAYEAYLTSKLVHSLYRSSEIKKWVNLSSNLKSKKLGSNN